MDIKLHVVVRRAIKEHDVYQRSRERELSLLASSRRRDVSLETFSCLDRKFHDTPVKLTAPWCEIDRSARVHRDTLWIYSTRSRMMNERALSNDHDERALNYFSSWQWKFSKVRISFSTKFAHRKQFTFFKKKKKKIESSVNWKSLQQIVKWIVKRCAISFWVRK